MIGSLVRAVLLPIAVAVLAVSLMFLFYGYRSIRSDMTGEGRVTVSDALKAAAKAEPALYSVAAKPGNGADRTEYLLRWTSGAAWLWLFWSRDEVAELAVNRLWYLPNATTVADVTETCFGVGPAEVDYPQAATLLEIARAPSRYARGANADRLLEARNRLLERLSSAGAVGPGRLQDLAAQPLDSCWD